MATKGDISDLEPLIYGGQPVVPLVEGFTRTRQGGVIRSDVSGGASRQRKKYYGTTHLAQATFYLRSPAMQDYIQMFINSNEGKRWICHLSADRPLVEPYVVQALTDWNHTEVNALRGTVTVQLEIFSARDECLDAVVYPIYQCIGDDVCVYLDMFGTMTEWWPTRLPITQENNGVTLDFINQSYYKNTTSRQLGEVIQFNRSTIGTDLVNGVLTNFPVDVPRVADGGLLVEGSATNILTFSDQFNNAAWQKINSSVTSDSTTAPNLSISADKIIENTASSTHVLRRTLSLTPLGRYSLEYFLKPDTRTSLTVVVSNSAAQSCSFHVNLVTREIAPGVTSLPGAKCFVDTLSDGWLRVSVVFTAGGAPLGSYTDLRISNVWPVLNNTGANYVGDGISGLYVWGGQFESSMSPSSYIATTAAALTRGADFARYPITDITGPDGTVYIEYDIDTVNYDRGLFSIGDNTSNHQIRCGYAADGQIQLVFSEAGVTVGTITADNPATPTIRLAVAYSATSATLCVNGVVSTAALTAPVTSLNQVTVGSYYAGTTQLNGRIRSNWYRPTRFADAELVDITI